ncbi:MAG: histidyl-tRNA synthetase [Candidatus Bathyarchaeota archaeon B63]|nr:MAG: histidyl-tRNA synthetase [Candidatus Bathyarchaeota archaeon B63]
MTPTFRQTVRGMRDFLPEEARRLRFIEQAARETARLYGYEEIITPVIEHYELLAAKIGEENRRRMYVFEDMGGRRVALRPEFTASIARVVATKLQSAPKPLRLFSVGSLYRYDEPQFGRYREFWQANFELFGSSMPEADAETIFLTESFLKRIGLRSYWFKVGHVGVLRGIFEHEGIDEETQNSIMQRLDKKETEDALRIIEESSPSKACLEAVKGLLGTSGRDSAKIVARMREIVKGYPKAIEAVENLDEILGLLKTGGVEAEIRLEAGFARGLEYYTGMIHEVYVPEMEIAVGGGGRYDKLVEVFGGGSTPAVGVAMGMDRLSIALEKQGATAVSGPPMRLLVIPVERSMLGEAFKVASMLREEGFSAEIETMGRSVTRALSDADRRGIAFTVIIGPKEIAEGKVVLRDMARREQITVKLDELPERLRG